MVLTLYSVSDGPPSLAVRMALRYLNLNFKLVEVDYAKGEFLTDKYAKLNPQKEIPVLNDDDFLLSESVAILQYLADKYSKDDTFYPKCVKERAIVNHRLMFNLASYYRVISEHVMAPIFFDYERTPLSAKKVEMALEVFDTILKTQNTEFAAGKAVTIGDLPLVTATLCLEAISYDFTKYTAVVAWYESFKKSCPQLWEIGEGGMKEIAEFNRNPPLLPDLHHPLHRTRK